LRAVLVCHRRPVVNLRACKFDDDTALSRHFPTRSHGRDASSAQPC
jgi:hypothetical protein